jgi:putative endonuclease
MPFQLGDAMYYTYLLQSDKDGRWYTGSTGDLKTRLADHLRGRVSSTRHRRPLRLIYYEACLSEADAKRRERYLKTGKGKRYLRQRLATWLAANSPQ